MTTTIYDVAKGDFAGIAQGDLNTGLAGAGEPRIWVKINHVEAVIDQINPLHYRSWHVVTTTGIRLSMFDIAAYRTAAEMQAETQK